MTETELSNIQDIYFDNAAEFLRKGDEIPSVGYIITRVGQEDELLNDGNFKLEIVNMAKDTDDKEGYAMIAIDMIPDDDELLKQIITIFPRMRDEVATIMARGRDIFGLSEEVIISTAVKSILEVNHLDRGDIVAHTVRNMCKITKAIAFLHVSEAYQISLEDTDNQNRVECLMVSLEAYNIRRMLTAPIVRDAPEGKIVSVGEKEEQVNFQGGGRFASLLQPVD